MPTVLLTSLSEIKSFDPCCSGWKNILKGQGKTQADDVLFPLIDCLESNSTRDVLWLLGNRKKEIEIAVKFARDCADSVSHLKNDASYASSADAAYAASNTASYASSAASNAAYAADAAESSSAAEASYAASAYDKQKELNKQFLINRIKEYEETH